MTAAKRARGKKRRGEYVTVGDLRDALRLAADLIGSVDATLKKRPPGEVLQPPTKLSTRMGIEPLSDVSRKCKT